MPAFLCSIATSTQRNRRLLLTLPACAVPMLSACGGGADLSYDTEQALYVVGEAITPNNPQVTIDNPKGFSYTAPIFVVAPVLPPGLTLNNKTGVISGTPTKLSRQSTHTVVATNNRGVAQTQVRITVTGRGAWSPGTSTQVVRQSACIAPLPGGKFLVAGGNSGGGWTDRAEIYDAAIGNWTPAARMLALRFDPMCMALRDQRVLVFGGSVSTGGAIPAELYDPFANTWTATGSMVSARRYAGSCLLPDGKVMVTGGRAPFLTDGDDVPPTLATIELYDPSTGLWTTLPKPMADPRMGHAAVLLPGGKSVLLVGDNASPGGIARVELYPLDGGPSKLIPSAVRGLNTQAVVLDDGSVLIATNATESWRFYPRTFTWKSSTHTTARYLSQMVLLADGRVLRAGGVNLNTAEIYNPDLNIWTAAAPMAEVRYAASAILLANGRVLMVNGRESNNSTEIYTP